MYLKLVDISLEMVETWTQMWLLSWEAVLKKKNQTYFCCTHVTRMQSPVSLLIEFAAGSY